MDSAEKQLKHRHLVDSALRFVLQRDILSRDEIRTLWRVLPNAVDEFITEAGFREAPASTLRCTAALSLWQHLERATWHLSDADTPETLQAFAALAFPQLTDLTVNLGRTDPAAAVAALAGARWPRLGRLTVCMSYQSPWVDKTVPGERWTAALAALSASAALPVHTLILEATDQEEAKKAYISIDFPMADMARCFAPTLSKLRLEYKIGKEGADALATAPPPAPNMARVEILNCADHVIESISEEHGPWPSVTTFIADECHIQSALDGFGTAIPAVRDLWITCSTYWPEFDTGESFLKSLEATAVEKLIVRWGPVKLPTGAAGVRLRALKVLSLRYTYLAPTGKFELAQEGMNALLRADLPALEKLSLSFGRVDRHPKGGRQNTDPDYAQWQEVPNQTDIPENFWPSLRSFSLEELRVCREAADFVRERILPRVAEVRITPRIAL